MPRNTYPNQTRYVYRHPITDKWHHTRLFEKLPDGTVEIKHADNEREASILKDRLNYRDGFGKSLVLKVKDNAVDLYDRRKKAFHYNYLIDNGWSKRAAARHLGHSRDTLDRWIIEDGDRLYDPRLLDPYGDPRDGYEGQLKSFSRNAWVNGRSPIDMANEAPRKPKAPSHIKHYRLLVRAEEVSRQTGVGLYTVMEQISRQNGLRPGAIKKIHERYRVHEKGVLGSGWLVWNDLEKVSRWWGNR